MCDIAVSFFSEPHASSRTRRVSFPSAARQDLHRAICRAMQGTSSLPATCAPTAMLLHSTVRGSQSASESFSPGNQA